MRLTNRAMTMTYIMLVLFVFVLGCLSYLLGFVAQLHVPGMVAAFVIVTFLVNTSFFFLLNFRTDWDKCIAVMKANEAKEEEQGMDMVRARADSNASLRQLSITSKDESKKQGLLKTSDSTNYVSIN